MGDDAKTLRAEVQTIAHDLHYALIERDELRTKLAAAETERDSLRAQVGVLREAFCKIADIADDDDPHFNYKDAPEKFAAIFNMVLPFVQATAHTATEESP